MLWSLLIKGVTLMNLSKSFAIVFSINTEYKNVFTTTYKSYPGLAVKAAFIV